MASAKTSKTHYRTNNGIRAQEVRLIGEDGQAIGVMSIEEALQRSYDAGLDLVEISPNAKPPVCKIIDYGKFMFDLAKREKEARKKQKVIEVKEVWLRMGIDQHDINFKAKNACKFLEDGDNVRVRLSFRGREMTRTEMGAEVLNKFIELCADYGEPEHSPKMEGRNMTVTLVPNKD